MDLVPSKLYVLASPIGNRDDITIRTLALLKSLNVFFVEDTREFRKLLYLLSLDCSGKTVYSYAKHNMKTATSVALGHLSRGTSIGLLSDRGTPGISDPGSLLVDQALDASHAVCPIPGPSALVSALSVCGFGTDRFQFLGFLPEDSRSRSQLFVNLKKNPVVFCFYESPRRIRGTMTFLAQVFPDGRAFFAREMTKIHESYQRVNLSRIDTFEIREQGEFTVVIEPCSEPEHEGNWKEELERRLFSDREWAKAVALKYNAKASDIYNSLQKKKMFLKNP